MKTLLISFCIIFQTYAFRYEGRASERKTEECAKHELMQKSHDNSPYPSITEFTFFKNTDFLPFFLRSTSTYRMKAINSLGERFRGFITVSNFTNSVIIDGERRTQTTCRMHVPLCNERLLGFSSLEIKDTRGDIIISRFYGSCPPDPATGAGSFFN